jgi:thiol-disulfide isomerase/thioredoxin
MLTSLLLLAACGSSPETTEPAAPAESTPVPRATPSAEPGQPRIEALRDPASVPRTAHGLENGDFVPELALTDLLSGSDYRLSDHLGLNATLSTRAAVIGFVASWCGPCRASLPTLAELKREHGDDLQIVLLATDKDLKGRMKEVAHVRAAGLDAVVLDPTPAVIAAYRGRKSNVPKFYIVNKIGEVLVQDSGFGKKVKPMLPKQVRYALNHPEYTPRPKRAKKRRRKVKPTG